MKKGSNGTAALSGTEMGADLARQLAEAGGWMTWTLMPLGSVWRDNPGIADVLAISKTYVDPVFKIYEVKISRSDFLHDVQMEKYKRYLPCCNQLYFACPAGMVDKTEVPREAGLICRGPKGWRTFKAPMYRHDVALTQNFLMALLMKGYQDHWPRRRLEDKKLDYKGFAAAAGEFGKKFSADILAAPGRVEEANKLRQDIEEVVGKSCGFGEGVYEIRREIDRLLGLRKYAPDAVKLAELTMEVFDGGDWRMGQVVEELREIADQLEQKRKSDGQDKD